MSATRGGSVLTFESIASQYPLDRFILLMPQVSRNLLTTVPMWSLDVATVKVDPNNEKMAYEIGYQSGDFGLTKVSLDLLATAADLSVAAKRIDDHHDKGFAEYEAHAIMSTPSGGVRGQGRTCEWNADIELEKVEAAAVRYVQKGIREKWNGFNADTGDAKYKQRVADQWLRAREFGKRMTESKAGNRAVRALLGISPKYSFAELEEKEFAVVRFVFTPDLDDREVKMLVVSHGLQAQRMLYGQPAGPISSTTALPPAPETSLQLTGDQVAEAQAEEVHEPADDLPPELQDEPMDEWPDAVAIIGNIMAKIETVANKSTQTKLRNRLTKAIGNTDAAQVNAIMDYLLKQEDVK